MGVSLMICLGMAGREVDSGGLPKEFRMNPQPALDLYTRVVAVK